MSPGAFLGTLLLLVSVRVSIPQSIPGCTVNVTDVSYINDTSSCSCNSGISLVGVSDTTAPPVVTWASTYGTAAIGYQVFYWLRRSTIVVTKTIYSTSATNTTLDQLTNPEVYRVAMRPICGSISNSSYGPTTPFDEFTIALAPTAAVSNVDAITPFNGSYTVALLKWDPIPWTQWNGDPLGYYICLGKTTSRFANCSILVNDASKTQYILTNLMSNTQYYVGMKAMSSGGIGPGPNATSETYFMTKAPPTVTQDFLTSAYVYMLIPAAVFMVVILLMVVVVCKKESEKKKQVTYCKDIYVSTSPNGSHFYRPTTSHSDVRASQRNRPLPHSPVHNTPGGPLPQMVHQQSQGAFSNSAISAATQLGRVPATVGGGGGGHHELDAEPQVTRGNIETGSILSSSVFSGVQSHPTSYPATAQPRPRDRAQTTAGGIPSPYEVPGNTLPRGEHMGRSFSTSGQSQVARDYPHHPSHSPQGHEPLEGFSRVPPAGIHQPIPQQRSTGVVAPLLPAEHERGVVPIHRGGGAAGGGGYPTTSPPHPRGEDTILECSGEVVYIDRPLEGVDLHQDGVQLDPYSVGTGGEYTNGSIATASSEHYSSYSEVTDPSNSLSHRVQPPSHPPYHPAPRDRRRQRDSEFSETSSFSGSSGSVRARSPGRDGIGWDQQDYRRGATSDVGHQRDRSVSPVDHRSEVGAMPYRKQSQPQTQIQRPSISYNSSSKLVPMTTEGAIN